jgi:uncharacterized damage-inducible protein DinB
MNAVIQSMIAELEQEAAATRRVLKVVPEDKLAWKPHAKSRSLGELAYHVAGIPGNVSRLLLLDGYDAKKANFGGPSAESVDQLLSLLDDGVKQAKSILADLSDEKAGAIWTLTAGDRTVFSIPRLQVARNVLFNHTYHHRGQLTVYLRILDVPLPVVYGRSADTNPFAD